MEEAVAYLKLTTDNRIEIVAHQRSDNVKCILDKLLVLKDL